MRQTLLSFALVLLAVAPGCGSSSPSAADSGPAAPDHSPAEGGPPAGWAFVAEDTGEKPAAVALKLGGVSGDEVTLRVTGRGVTSLQGVAFRLAFDPAQVQVTASELGGAWVGSSAQVISRFATRPEGELWAGIGHAGRHAIPAVAEVELARFKLKLSGAGSVKIGFRAGRNLALDPDLKGVPLEWLGGTFQRLR